MIGPQGGAEELQAQRHPRRRVLRLQAAPLRGEQACFIRDQLWLMARHSFHESFVHEHKTDSGRLLLCLHLKQYSGKCTSL